MIHRIGVSDRVRRLVLEGPHRGDWVEMNQLLHHVVLLEPVSMWTFVEDDGSLDHQRGRIIYRHARFYATAPDLHVDELWVVEGYVPDDWDMTRRHNVPRLAQVGLVAQALLSS